MSIENLKKRYFWLKNNDVTTQTEPQPQTFEKDSSVTPLIDMKEYMQQLIHEIKQLKKGDFLYISGWLFSWLGPDSQWGFFGVDDTTHGPGNKKFTDLLIEKAKVGVDVRVLGWVSYSGMGGMPIDGDVDLLGVLIKWGVMQVYPYAKLNGYTMNSVRSLRTEPQMTHKAMLNLLSHPAGSVHIKMVVLGNTTAAVGFTGGLDLSQWRWAEYGHLYCPNPTLPDMVESLDWHDVQAMVKGKAVQAFHDLFRDMWNENLKRKQAKFLLLEQIEIPGAVKIKSQAPFNFKILSYETGAEKVKVPERTMAALPQGSSRHYIQSLRTIPTINFKKNVTMPMAKPYSGNQNGLFELKAAWKKAILGAQQYIYIEDNSFMSQEVLLWINEAIKNNPNLSIILLKGGGADPADAVVQDKKTAVLANFTINEGLLKDITTDQNKLNQIRIFQAWGTTVDICQTLSKNLKSTPVMPLVEVKPIPLDPLASEVVTGWKWDGKGDLAQKIQAIAGVKATGELKGDVLVERAQLRIVGGPSYKILGNPVIKDGEHIALKIEHGALPPFQPGQPFSPNIPPPPQKGQNASLHVTYGIYVHAKTTIIDDNWAMIGSNNVWRRSLYTDWEHAVSFIDEDGQAVKNYRARLWAEHFRLGTPQGQLPSNFFATASLKDALATWFIGANLPQRDSNDPGPDYLRAISLPIKVAAPDSETLKKVMDALDETYDPDSRKPWALSIPPKTM